MCINSQKGKMEFFYPLSGKRELDTNSETHIMLIIITLLRELKRDGINLITLELHDTKMSLCILEPHSLQNKVIS